MINLLPEEHKKQLRAGLANTLLIRYNVLFGIVVVVLVLILAGAYFLLQNIRNTAEANIQENTTQAAEYSEVEARAATFRSNLAIAKQIIDNETSYSDLIIDIARVLPSNVIMESLSLDVEAFGTPTQMAFRGRSYDDALRLKTALQDSSLFSDANIASATYSEDDETGYPVSISMNVTLVRESATQ